VERARGFLQERSLIRRKFGPPSKYISLTWLVSGHLLSCELCFLPGSLRSSLLRVRLFNLSSYLNYSLLRQTSGLEASSYTRLSVVFERNRPLPTDSFPSGFLVYIFSFLRLAKNYQHTKA
jgi:hypothetical protein